MTHNAVDPRLSESQSSENLKWQILELFFKILKINHIHYNYLAHFIKGPRTWKCLRS